MKMRIASLSLLTICCLIAPVKADQILYDNGPYNGTTDAWTINFGFAVSDSFITPGNVNIQRLHIVYWDASTTDLLTTIDMQIGATSFGGNAQTVGGAANTFLGTNQFGYALYQADYSFSSISWNGVGYVTLSNACTTSGCSVSNPIYWDENSGVGCTSSPFCPSTAFENTLGSIPSETFTLTGNYAEGVPEPSSALLFGSGILGLAGILRRKLSA